MKNLVVVVALAGYTFAYPFMMDSVMEERESAESGCYWNFICPMHKVDESPHAIYAKTGNCGSGKGCGGAFNAAQQYVSTSSIYQYIKPRTSDIRGPCPGLNAAANHGYINRNGVTNISDAVGGLAAAWGMGNDLASQLSALAIVQSGDSITGQWSIGGAIPGASGGMLAGNSGISNSHNKYETDGSQTRCDAYMNAGDAHSAIVSRFAATYNSRLVRGRGAIPGNQNDAGYTLDSFAQDYLCKSDWSIAKNARYVAMPLAGVIVAPVAYNFAINFMSNHSVKNPEGWLSPEMYKMFFAMTGSYPNFTWLPGQERIPNNWYRRPAQFKYNSTALVNDLVLEYASYSDAARLGCNNGKVNTYVQRDVSGVLAEFSSHGFLGNYTRFVPPNCPGIS